MSNKQNDAIEESKKEAEEETTIMEKWGDIEATIAKLSQQVEELSKQNAKFFQNQFKAVNEEYDDWRDQQENVDRGRNEDIERHFTNPLEH